MFNSARLVRVLELPLMIFLLTGDLSLMSRYYMLLFMIEDLSAVLFLFLICATVSENLLLALFVYCYF